MEDMSEFIPYIIYESIVCVFNKKTHDINSSCMGVTISPSNHVFFHSYTDTDTYSILKNQDSKMQFSINFSYQFSDYVKASLHDNPELSKETFILKETVPVLNNCPVSLICELSDDDFGEETSHCKGSNPPNIQAIIKKVIKNNNPYMINNRSWNNALEALIITTKLTYYKTSDMKKYDWAISQITYYFDQIKRWNDMERFTEGYSLIKNYLKEIGINL